MKKRFLLFAFILFIPYQLAAQNYRSFDVKRPMMINEDVKSVSQARGIALTNTFLPIASGLASLAIFESESVQTIGAITVVYGMIMGPSTGNFYANDYSRGLLGLVTRAAGVYLLADASSEIFGRNFADALNVDDKKVSLTDTKMVVGQLLILGSAAYNIISAGKSVKEYNERYGYNVSVSTTAVNDRLFPVLTMRLSL